MATSPQQLADDNVPMTAPPVIKNNTPWLIMRLVFSAAGLPLCIWAIANLAASMQHNLNIRSADPKRRAAGLTKAGNERDARTFDEVLSVLGRETDRDLLERAGYAAMRIGDMKALSLLMQRADEGPDDLTKAKLILDSARLAGRDPRLNEWLMAGATSDQPWRQAGSRVALAESGRPDGGRLLVTALPTLQPDMREFAINEFRGRIGAALMEAAGVVMDWADLSNAPTSDPRWAMLRDFWENRVSTQLLNDVLDRQDRKDADWYQVGRLIHARDQLKRKMF